MIKKYVLILLCICFNIYAQEVNEATMQKEKTFKTLLMSVGQHTFKLNLYENETTKAFIKKLPLTMDMNELGGNEKYFHFSTALPTQSFNPKMIHTGDVMLWGNNSLVLFYKTFSTSYAYTKIGYIEDTTHLEDVLGKGNVVVKFALE
ncbi:MAG: hypothetical protein H6Q35_209 [Proteobacteria bacterium]|nr:hypothetical protein [Pseudomonadota bacterium]